MRTFSGQTPLDWKINIFVSLLFFSNNVITSFMNGSHETRQNLVHTICTIFVLLGYALHYVALKQATQNQDLDGMWPSFKLPSAS